MLCRPQVALKFSFADKLLVTDAAGVRLYIRMRVLVSFAVRVVQEALGTALDAAFEAAIVCVNAQMNEKVLLSSERLRAISAAKGSFQCVLLPNVISQLESLPECSVAVVVGTSKLFCFDVDVVKVVEDVAFETKTSTAEIAAERLWKFIGRQEIECVLLFVISQ